MRRSPARLLESGTVVRWQGFWGVIGRIKDPTTTKKAFHPWEAPPVVLEDDDEVDVLEKRQRPSSDAPSKT